MPSVVLVDDGSHLSAFPRTDNADAALSHNATIVITWSESSITAADQLCSTYPILSWTFTDQSKSLRTKVSSGSIHAGDRKTPPTNIFQIILLVISPPFAHAAT